MWLKNMTQLGLLQTRYVLAMARHAPEARFFWSTLYEAARASDKTLTATIGHGLVSAHVETLLPGIGTMPVSLTGFVEEYGAVSFAEIRVLVGSVALLKPKVLFELGTYRGATTLQLALNAVPEATIHTLDLPEDHPLRSSTHDVVPPKVGELFFGTPQAGRVTQHLANSLEFDESALVRGCDWIFIDGSHEYDCVKSDSQKALRMVKPGGVVFWHDVNPSFPGNCRALAEVAGVHALFHIDGTSLAFHRAPA